MFWRWERSFHCVECNNQIEAENSSHQALKRAWEQLSFRIRRWMTNPRPLEQSLRQRRITKKKYHKEKNSHFKFRGVVVQFAAQVCLQLCLPVVVWAQHAAISHWARLCKFTVGESASAELCFTVGAAAPLDPAALWAGAGPSTATTPPSLLLLSPTGDGQTLPNHDLLEQG